VNTDHNTDHSVVNTVPDPGSIELAATVAASLNHQHNDLLLTNEIAQIAAESAAADESIAAIEISHEQHLAHRRRKDRERYASMTEDQRESYNKKRRDQYHRQSEESRRKRRERERNRYHSLTADRAKERNARRAALERDRYKKLSPNELAARNAKRRERAAMLRAQKKVAQQGLVLESHATEAVKVTEPAPSATAPTPAETTIDTVAAAVAAAAATVAVTVTETTTTTQAASDLDTVRVYHDGMNPEVNFDTQTASGDPILQNIQGQQPITINLQTDPSIPNADDSDGVAV